jgi:hypothetical protein
VCFFSARGFWNVILYACCCGTARLVRVLAFSF